MGLFHRGGLGKEEAEYCRDRGIAYYSGKGQEQNYRRALKWFTQAAANGDNIAQYYLGLMYECGTGVLKNSSKALYWYKKSGTQGNLKAQKAAADILEKEPGGSRDGANAWLKKAAENNDTSAMLEYGRRCQNGLAQAADNSGKTAIKYYEMSETDEGRYLIACIYILGSCSDVPMDKGKGCEILRGLCGVNSSVTYKAQKLYNEQFPLIKTTEEIQGWLAEAHLLQQKAWTGDKEAEAELLTVYYPKLAAVTRTDCGFDRMEFFLDAANHGDLTASHWYGHQLLKNGNISGGIKWLEISADNGSIASTKLLAYLYSGKSEFKVPFSKSKLRRVTELYKKQLNSLKSDKTTADIS